MAAAVLGPRAARPPSTQPMVDAAFENANCGPACPDITDPLCSCTGTPYYWTSTVWMPFPGDAYIVHMGSGRVDVFEYTGFIDVRAVRGGS